MIPTRREVLVFLSHWRRQSPHTKEPVIRESTTFIGLDAHKDFIHAAVLFPGHPQAVADAMAHEPERLRRWARRSNVGLKVWCGAATRPVH